ncbi:MAG: glycosyltransferase, partial [Ignavibacteria bacterium]|nr:glycosyltransferase [Ignavibacteria bacterium]
KIPCGKVSENFLIDKTCKRVIHYYIDLETEEKISAHLRSKYSYDFSKLKSVTGGDKGISDPSALKNFGLRTKGIIKENRPGLPLISIIIPSFNSEKVIEQAIQSAIVQSYENKEILIIDGNSKDSTAVVVKKYEDQIDWFNSEPDKNIFDRMTCSVIIPLKRLWKALKAEEKKISTTVTD